MSRRTQLLAVAALVAVSLSTIGASCGGVRHTGAVSITSIVQTVKTIQTSEVLLVCGKPSAPPEGQCIPSVTHKQIEQKLFDTLELTKQATLILRDLPEGAPEPIQVIQLISDVGSAIETVLQMIPSSPQKSQLVAAVGGGK